jgi:uncharacterized protein
MKEIEIKWDEPKNVINKRKHGVSFEEASTVFSDEYAFYYMIQIIQWKRTDSSS